jgi:hypothetical protein
MTTARRRTCLPLVLIIGASAWIAAPAGCVERTMRVETNPPGALVYMNYQEVGRTPLERDFTWYGTYDVQVRNEGYETLKTRTKVIAPWWQWPPFDLVAELLPFRLKDERRVAYTLKPASTQPVEPSEILSRAEEMRDRLESSRHRTERTTPPEPAPPR